MNILEEIAAKTRERVAEARNKVSLEEMKQQAESLNTETGFPFENAIKEGSLSFICEVKKASPSKGLIAGDFPYVEIAKEYEKGAVLVYGQQRIFKRDKGCGRYSYNKKGFYR